jgi:hypothetical protein
MIASWPHESASCGLAFWACRARRLSSTERLPGRRLVASFAGGFAFPLADDADVLRSLG